MRHFKFIVTMLACTFFALALMITPLLYAQREMARAAGKAIGVALKVNTTSALIMAGQYSPLHDVVREGKGPRLDVIEAALASGEPLEEYLYHREFTKRQ